MSYIVNSNDGYYVIKDFGDNFLDLHRRKDVFEVDELLAYPIAVLCNKGYITEMCCSGHAFGTPYFKRIENDRALGNIEDTILLYEYISDYEGNYVCCQGKPETGTFIKFEEDMNFQSIPKGWKYNNCFLEFELPMQKNPSIYYSKLMEGILSLTEWIEKLPDKK